MECCSVLPPLFFFPFLLRSHHPTASLAPHVVRFTFYSISYKQTKSRQTFVALFVQENAPTRVFADEFDLPSRFTVMQSTEFLSYLPLSMSSLDSKKFSGFFAGYALLRTNVFFLQTLFPNSIVEI